MSYVLKVPSGQRIHSVKKQMINDLGLTDHPSSYSKNTAKEDTILEYVEDFRRQFVQVFPARRPLLLCPSNECGVRKFVCTTVRPTLLKYSDLYDIRPCAKFVADFLEYLPLDEPTTLPDLLPSPGTIISLRAGDCLDFSNLLVSLLRGAGYDAYVVCGYAPKWVCMNDETKVAYHLLDKFDPSVDTSAPKEEEEVDPDAKEKYKIKVPPKHVSKFVTRMAKEAEEKEAQREQAEKEPDTKEEEVEVDELQGARVHCWVLVKAGTREMKVDVYVEPSTGALYKLDESPYLGVESIWNESNYWANVQSEPVKDMKYDLGDSGCWEYVLIDDKQGAEQKEEVSHFADDSAKAEEAPLAPEDIADDRDILDAPMSWCSEAQVMRELYRNRYPKGKKLINYYKCTVHKYDDYYPGADGLTLKITEFEDEACTEPREIRETFAHRKDKLIARRTFSREGRVQEIFEPGRSTGIKEYTTFKDEKRLFHFYSNARVDGMIKRDETIGVKVVEEFENTDDFLTYRSIAVDTSGNLGNTRRVKGYSVALSRSGEQPVRKITEKFRRNRAVPAEEDVRKRTHFISEGTIRLDYHYGKNNVTHSVHLVDKTEGEQNKSTTYRVDRDFKSPTRAAQREELQTLTVKEKELLNKVKERENLIAELITKLEKEKHNVQLEKSIYDIAHEQSKESEKERKDESDDKSSKNTLDYLSPFLAQYPAGKPLTRFNAQQARDECLAALKERLLERANIIQAHLEDENQKLHQRQAVFKRQAGSGGAEADEDFTKYYQEAAFRIDILNARLTRHEELAVQKYYAMDRKLKEDPRLRILHEAE